MFQIVTATAMLVLCWRSYLRRRCKVQAIETDNKARVTNRKVMWMQTPVSVSRFKSSRRGRRQFHITSMSFDVSVSVAYSNKATTTVSETCCKYKAGRRCHYHVVSTDNDGSVGSMYLVVKQTEYPYPTASTNNAFGVIIFSVLLSTAPRLESC